MQVPAGRPSPPSQPDWAQREPHPPEPVWLDSVSGVAGINVAKKPLLLPAAVVKTVPVPSNHVAAPRASTVQQPPQQQPQAQPQQQQTRLSAEEQQQYQQHWQQEQLQYQQQRQWHQQQRRDSQRRDSQRLQQLQQQQRQQPASVSASEPQQESHQQWQPLVMPQSPAALGGYQV